MSCTVSRGLWSHPSFPQQKTFTFMVLRSNPGPSTCRTGISPMSYTCRPTGKLLKPQEHSSGFSLALLLHMSYRGISGLSKGQDGESSSQPQPGHWRLSSSPYPSIINSPATIIHKMRFSPEENTWSHQALPREIGQCWC